jgi:hypothetical protein
VKTCSAPAAAPVAPSRAHKRSTSRIAVEELLYVRATVESRTASSIL